MSNNEAFQDFIVHGTWDVNKYGSLLDQFLDISESSNDSDKGQLLKILRGMQSIIMISHGDAWEGMLGLLIRKIEEGRVGRINTPQVKWVIEETWATCNSVLREDTNVIVIQNRDHGETTSFDINKIEELVQFFKAQFDSIPETTYATGSEFEVAQKRRASTPTEVSKTKVIGQTFKHERTGESSDERPHKKAQTTTTEPGVFKRNPSEKTTGGGAQKGGKSEEYRREKALGQSTDKGPYLCIFNLRHQYLGAKSDSKKGESCDRDHFDRALKGTHGYRWTLATLSSQVDRASETILKTHDKKKLIEAMKVDFNSP